MELQNPSEIRYWGMKENSFTMLMHLSQLLNFAGGVGVIIPIVMWATNKDDSKVIDRQGKHIINWLISALIYSIVSFALTFVLIGFVGLAVLGVLSLVFPIIAALKANDGKEWKYPLTIEFMK